jgi:hypothetical protein
VATPARGSIDTLIAALEVRKVAAARFRQNWNGWIDFHCFGKSFIAPELLP